MMAEASSSSSSARTTVTNTKFEMEKFDGTNNLVGGNVRCWMSYVSKSWTLLLKKNLT